MLNRGLIRVLLPLKRIIELNPCIERESLRVYINCARPRPYFQYAQTIALHPLQRVITRSRLCTPCGKVPITVYFPLLAGAPLVILWNEIKMLKRISSENAIYELTGIHGTENEDRDSERYLATPLWESLDSIRIIRCIPAFGSILMSTNTSN